MDWFLPSKHMEGLSVKRVLPQPAKEEASIHVHHRPVIILPFLKWNTCQFFYIHYLLIASIFSPSPTSM